MSLNHIYQKEWAGGNGWKWKLEILPCQSTANILNPSYVRDLNWRSLNEIESGYSCKLPDKIPIGMSETDILELEFDLKYCDSDLIDALYNPYVLDGCEYNIPATSQTSELITNFDKLNSFFLWTDYGYNDNIYKLVFIGVQKKSIEKEITFNTNGVYLKIELHNILKYILENITYKEIYNRVIKEITNTDYYISNDVIECSYARTINKYDPETGEITNTEIKDYSVKDTVYSDQLDFDALFIKSSYIKTKINEIINDYLCLLLNLDNSNSYTEINGNEFSAYTYYKQVLYNPEDEPTSTVADPLILAIVYDNSNSFHSTQDQVSGFLWQGDNDDIKYKSFDNLLEYYKQITEANLLQLVYYLDFDEVNNTFKVCLVFKKILFNDSKRTITKYPVKFTEQIGDELVINIATDIIREARGNLENTTADDEQEYNYTLTGSRAENDFEYKPILHNVLHNIDDETKAITDNCRNKYFTDYLYYQDSNIIYKVDEKITINDGINTYGWYNLTWSPVIDVDGNVYKGILFANIFNFQKSSNQLNNTSRVIAELFGDPKIMVYEAEFDLRRDLMPDMLGSYFSLSEIHDADPYHNTSLLSSLFSHIPNNKQTVAILTSSEVNIAKGTVKCKFLIPNMSV